MAKEKKTKTRKTRKTKVEEPEVEEVEAEEESEEESNSEPVSSLGRSRRTNRDQSKHFTALLMEGTTYEIFGMKFRRGVPQQVPMKYYAKFQSNGWFQLSNIGR